MRNLVQAQIVAKLGEIAQQLDQAAIVGLEEGLEDRQSEELMLREILSGILRGVGRQGIAGDALMMKVLQDHVKATIAPYKYPRSVKFVDALPKTQTGKIQRFKLRE